MEPINQKDINTTFLKFLGIFLFSVALIVGAVYFDSIIPKKELTKLKIVKNDFDVEKDYQRSFRKKLKEINLYFDSLDSSNAEGYNFDYLIGLKIAEMDQEIKGKINNSLERNDIDKSEKSADSSRLAMYSEMVNSLRALHKSQLENVSMKRMIQPMKDYKDANDRYQKEYEALQGELTRCQGLVLDLYKKNGPK